MALVVIYAMAMEEICSRVRIYAETENQLLDLFMNRILDVDAFLKWYLFISSLRF